MQTTSPTPINIAIAGCLGRMGRMLQQVASTTANVTLVAGSVLNTSEISQATEIANSFGHKSILITTSTKELVSAADAIIDFTGPEYSLTLSQEIAAQGKTHIIGTTGFSDAQMVELTRLSSQARIIKSGNFSIGVNVVAKLVEQAATMLHNEYDIEIVEMHHRHKKDAPSGTAIMLAESAANGRDVALQQKRRHYGEGQIGERELGTIGIVARRGGEIIGDHTVTFAGDHEIIEISHRSFSRGIYAQGAIQAALWAASQPFGLYSMKDVVK